MSSSLVVKHVLTDKEAQPRQKRFKVGKACYTCRIKKIKCDGLQPCMQCKARRRPCTFSKDGSMEDEEEQSATSSLASSPTPPPPPSSSSATTNIIDNNPIMQHHSNNKKKQQLRQQADHVALETGLLLDKLYKLQQLPAAQTIDFDKLNRDQATETTNSLGSEFLPSKTLQQQFIYSYFKHCYSVFPVVYMRLFFKQFGEQNQSVLTSPILLLMLCAHGADRLKQTEKSMLYFSNAKALLAEAIEQPNLSTAIALMLMSLYESVENQCCTMYRALAFQMCFDLNLFRNYNNGYIVNTDNSDMKELKKRVCWGCYYLDKITHIQSGQPWSIRQKDIELDMPLLQPEDDEKEHKILECFITTLKLLQIAERILQPQSNTGNHNNQQQHDQLLSLNNDNELLHWSRSLPSYLQANNNNNSPMVYQIHITYNLVELHILKPFLSVKSIETRSINTAHQIIRLISPGHIIFNYHFTVFALIEAVKICLTCAVTDKTLFQQAIELIKNFMQQNTSLCSMVHSFAKVLDDTLFQDADHVMIQEEEEEEDIMTPFMISSLSSSKYTAESERQHWSKLDYFSNGLITPHTIKPRTNTMSMFNPNNEIYQHSASEANYLFQPQPQQQQWRTHTNSVIIPYDNNTNQWQSTHQSLKSTSLDDIAALVAQTQDKENDANKAWVTPNNPSSNNDSLLYTLLTSSSTASSNVGNTTTAANINSASSSTTNNTTTATATRKASTSYPYTNVGLGIYASAHQHHNDVIRQHLPNNDHPRPVLLSPHGQVIVSNTNNQINN